MTVAELSVAVLLVLVGVAATVVVLTRDPTRQALVLSAYGLLLGVLMLALSAPDVAMSQLAVGAAVVPLLVALAIVKCEKEVRARRRAEDAAGEER